MQYFHFLKGLRVGILVLFKFFSWCPCQCYGNAFCWILSGCGLFLRERFEGFVGDALGSSISDSGSDNVFFLLFLLWRGEPLFLEGEMTSTCSSVSSCFLVSRFLFFFRRFIHRFFLRVFLRFSLTVTCRFSRWRSFSSLSYDFGPSLCRI